MSGNCRETARSLHWGQVLHKEKKRIPNQINYLHFFHFSSLKIDFEVLHYVKATSLKFLISKSQEKQNSPEEK